MLLILTNDRLKKKVQETAFLDGATSDNGRNSCIDVIIRDCSGNPIGALSEPLPSDFSAEVSRAIFESDALLVIQALTSGDLGGEVGHILHDIKSSSHSFSCYSFKHLKRDDD